MSKENEKSGAFGLLNSLFFCYDGKNCVQARFSPCKAAVFSIPASTKPKLTATALSSNTEEKQEAALPPRADRPGSPCCRN